MNQIEALIPTMPERARELIEWIGVDDAIKLMRRFGGHRLFIPATVPTEDSWLLEAGLSEEGIQKLIYRSPSTHIELPLNTRVEKLLRDNQIRHDYDELCRDGCKNPLFVLVERYRMTHRALRRIVREAAETAPRAQQTKPRRDPYTLDLFRTEAAT